VFVEFQQAHSFVCRCFEELHTCLPRHSRAVTYCTCLPRHSRAVTYCTCLPRHSRAVTYCTCLPNPLAFHCTHGVNRQFFDRGLEIQATCVRAGKTRLFLPSLVQLAQYNQPHTQSKRPILWKRALFGDIHEEWLRRSE
jgi:hypothetical protein